MSRKSKGPMSRLVVQHLLCWLMNSTFPHMLEWTDERNKEFSVLFMNKRNKQWEPKYLDLFKALDSISEKKAAKYKKSVNYDKECKKRCRSNLQKLCYDKVLENGEVEKVQESIIKVHYRFKEPICIQKEYGQLKKANQKKMKEKVSSVREVSHYSCLSNSNINGDVQQRNYSNGTFLNYVEDSLNECVEMFDYSQEGNKLSSCGEVSKSDEIYARSTEDCSVFFTDKSSINSPEDTNYFTDEAINKAITEVTNLIEDESRTSVSKNETDLIKNEFNTTPKGDCTDAHIYEKFGDLQSFLENKTSSLSDDNSLQEGQNYNLHLGKAVFEEISDVELCAYSSEEECTVPSCYGEYVSQNSDVLMEVESDDDECKNSQLLTNHDPFVGYFAGVEAL